MNTIEAHKQNHNIKTSEEIFDIEKQPDNQCPLIDEVIKEIKDRCLDIKYSLRDLKDVEGTEEQCFEIESAIGDIDYLDGNLEEIRENIIKLRTWGEAWKDLAKCAINRDGNIENFK